MEQCHPVRVAYKLIVMLLKEKFPWRWTSTQIISCTSQSYNIIFSNDLLCTQDTKIIKDHMSEIMRLQFVIKKSLLTDSAGIPIVVYKSLH
jgi:hypothetical protein